jgi:ABC-type transport system substrate-binding protein
LKDQYKFDPTQAKALLAAAGYGNGFHTNLVLDSAGDSSLFQIVQGYLADVNITMSISTTTNFVPQVMVAHSQDALASWVNGTYGLSYEPLIQLQRLHTDSFTDFALVSDPTFDAFLTTANAAASLDDVKTAVKNANLYVAQQHFAISLIDAPQFCYCQPWLKGYAQQASSLGGSGGGPQYFGHYAARFWVDSSLK